MRRISGHVLRWLALITLVGGPVFSLVLAPRLARLPADVNLQEVSEGRGVYLDTGRGFRLVGPVRLGTVHDLAGHAPAGSSGVVVWVARDRSLDLDHHRTLDRSTSWYALDPHTARAVACCRVGRDRHGALTQAFPPNTKATAYPWWDDTADRVETAAFGGTTNLGGISVYRFDVLVPPVAIDHVDVPAKAAGEAGAGPVSLDWWYRSRTDLLVDPVSGIILKGRQVADQWLADATGTRRLTVATTSLTDTPSTVAANMQLAAAARRPIQARSSWPFLLAPLVAVVLLAAAEAREAAGPGMTNATGRHPARGSFEPVGVGERDFGVRSRAS